MFKGKATGGTASAPDNTAIGRALALLFQPTDHLELRVLPGARSIVRRADALIDLIGFVEGQDDYKGIYYTLNPVRHDLMGAAKNGDILRRQWLLVDIDAVREPDTNASDREHEAARMLATKITGDLLSDGWPLPLTIDSGNGWHLLYKIDLPNDDLAKALCKDVLAALAARFDTERAKVDKSVHNAARIAKLPGTWARKAANTKDRPQRMCRVTADGKGGKIAVTVEQLQKLARKADPKKETPPSPAPPPPETPPTMPFRGRAKGEAWTAYASAALESEIERIKRAAVGERNNVLNTAAFCLATFVQEGHLTREQIEARLTDAALASGLSDVEIRNTLKSAINAGVLKPRTMPEPSKNGTHQQPPPGNKFQPGDLLIVRASEITPTRVRWLWQGRIATGKMTTFAGMGGLGKSFVSCDIAARVTTGREWPDKAPAHCTGSVLYISGEDDPDDTLVPRLIEAKADLNRVAFLKGEFLDKYYLADLEMLSEACKQLGDPRLVIIDPPTNYLGDTDDHKNAELRGLLSPFKEWCKLRDLAMIFITHVNKGGGAKVSAMMRVMGSVAWVNAVRSAHIFTRDPQDPDRRLFVGMKNNVGAERKGLAYRIVSADANDPDGPAKIEWLGEVDVSADEAMNNEQKHRPKRIEAVEWLEELFADRMEIPSKEIWKGKEATTISDNGLKEAKDEMGIQASRTVDTDGVQAWVWRWTQEARTRWAAKKQATEAGREAEGVRY